MRYSDLTEDDKAYFIQVYNSKLRQDADKELSEKFDISERSVRAWARWLGLTRGAKEEMKNRPVVTPVNTELETPAPFTYKPNGDPIFYRKGGKRVLVIGDIHAPFDLDSYLEHCKSVYEQFQLDTVVFIGDIIDNHYSSFHNTDPDGMGGADELEYAIERVNRYYEAFPYATVIVGNHDRMAARKAFAGGVPKQWIRTYSEVLMVPTWDFVTELELDNVLYFHGEGGTARTKFKTEEQSVVQGHLHTQCYVEWAFSKTSRKFAMQVGTGIDFEAYAFAYAKAGRKPSISSGVVLNGELAFVVPMSL